MSLMAYDRIARFVGEQSGIQISRDKAYMLEARLQPIIKQFGLSSFEMLANQLTAPSEELKQAVVDAMTTNESFFFRDRTPFKLLYEVMLPKVAEEKRRSGQTLRIWCAAAATGQEPYSLAISVLENHRALAGIDVQILATDISHDALQIAKRGLYNQFEVQRGLSAERMITHFEQCDEGWQAKKELRDMIEFKPLNLMRPFTHLGKFDIVFCRNVLIYFDVATKARVLEGISRQMHPYGYLMLGAAETLIGVSDKFAPTADHQNLFQPV